MTKWIYEEIARGLAINKTAKYYYTPPDDDKQEEEEERQEIILQKHYCDYLFKNWRI